ncbi:hypothetical protein CHS0354_010754 [Potamilus streckersoni]|uniref:Ribosomal protein eL8/eL30/eS12/Gadd45 domain-containing protein n=1 Tax=Potamilus streckersoni TaxID=2493646 RepID=A0AAE0T994_9BIVA|nr:hypothetical protein CHS0354_010754 [Potamilus streckersoni]
MTLPKVMDLAEIKETSTMTVEKALGEVLKRAFGEDRAICGVFECAQYLEADPEGVFICILSEDKSQDLAVRIQHTLFEAYCREHQIKFIKTDSCQKLSVISSSAKSKMESCHSGERLDFNCVLVRCSNILSPEEVFLSEYCENFLLGGLAYPAIVQIPV